MSLDSYSSYVREFRQSLLELNETNNTKEGVKNYMKKIFHILDENNDGILTTIELRHFINSLNINISHLNNNNNNNSNQSFAEILIHQIDINNDGKISYSELMEFLFPKEISQREIGVVIQKIRDALLIPLKDRPNSKGKSVLESDDITLIEAFAKLTNVTLLRGNLVEVRALKKAFSKVNNPILGVLSRYEIDILVASLDANGDGVVSAREFRKWLSRLEEEIEVVPNMNESSDFVKLNNSNNYIDNDNDYNQSINAKYQEIEPPQSPNPILELQLSDIQTIEQIEEEEQEEEEYQEQEKEEEVELKEEKLKSSTLTSKYEEIEPPESSPSSPILIELSTLSTITNEIVRETPSITLNSLTSTSLVNTPIIETPVIVSSPATIQTLDSVSVESSKHTEIETTPNISTITPTFNQPPTPPKNLDHSETPEMNIKLSSLNQRKNKTNNSNENQSSDFTESNDYTKSSSTSISSSSSPIVTPSSSTPSSSPSRISLHPTTIRCLAFGLGIIILWFTVYKQDKQQPQK